MATVDEVRAYWDQHIHDLEITTHPVGSRGFFDDLDQYHFEKLHHLLRLVDFNGYRGKAVLEVGCGAAVDLARFAKGGAVCTGVDLAQSAIALAKANFEQQGLQADLRVANGEALPFPDNSFDLVYAHGVVQYTADPQALVNEVRRVLKPGGLVFVQTHQTFPLHDEPWDFWRISADAWPALFNAKTGFRIIDSGMAEPLMFVARRWHPGVNLHESRGCAVSSVIAEKIGDTELSWDVELRDVLGSHDEVALVFAVFFVNQDDHAASGQLGDQLGDG